MTLTYEDKEANFNVYSDDDDLWMDELSAEEPSLLTIDDSAEENKSNIDESDNGVSNIQTQILYEIETNGGNVSDIFWQQYKEEIVEMEHAGLIEPLDVSGYGLIGQTVRTLKLTPKGRLTMMIGRVESTKL